MSNAYFRVHAMLLVAAFPCLFATESEEAAARTADLPELSDDGRQVRLTARTASFPIGVYVMCRTNLVVEKLKADSPLVRIASRDYVQGIALGITWADLQPTPDPPDASAIQRFIEQVEAACKLAGRQRPLPIFLKPYFAHTPKWCMTDEPVTEPRLLTNRLGMRVMRLPSRTSGTGVRLPPKELPISTDAEYHRQLERLTATVADWLAKFDPDGARVPLVHFVGPAMSSNQMRPPDRDIFPDSGPDKLGAGWTKQKHLDVWRSMARVMGRYRPLANRCWVFNFTNLYSGARRDWLRFSTEEQTSVLEVLRGTHPDGPEAVICKTESLTVDFSRRPNADPTAPGNYNQWRHQMLHWGKRHPYRYIAEQRFRHAWENWAGFSPARDKRAFHLYPLDHLMENSLYLDLEAAKPNSGDTILNS